MSDAAANSRYLIRLNRVDLITLSGVVSSLMAGALALNGSLYLATALLYVAMLADAMDGMLARKLGLERAFGRYLDGFMDVLIYLALPSMILYLSGFAGFWSICLLVMTGCGCIRLAVFNDVGNIQEDNGLAYLGMPVFWSLFILAGYLLLALVVPESWLKPLLGLTLLLFSNAMILRRRFFKFSRLATILALTLGGGALFLVLHLTVGGQ
jgi:CDP-diacylglycerol--serine O-phosphatidyltransferase